MKGLLIVGAGGHGKVVAETALASGQWDRIVFVDDKFPQLSTVDSWPVVGKVEDAGSLMRQFPEAAVAVGNADTRLRLLQILRQAGFGLPAIVHSTAWVSPSASLGEGCVVFAQAAVNAGSKIAAGVIINTGATVDHDCRVGEGSHICPGAHLAGEVHVDKCVWVGIGASLVHGIDIGSKVTIGAGAAVINDIEDHVTVVGVPAKVIRRHA